MHMLRQITTFSLQCCNFCSSNAAAVMTYEMHDGAQAVAPDAALGGICRPIEAMVSGSEGVVQALAGLGHGPGDWAQHRLHHSQVLHVLMRLEQSITCSPVLLPCACVWNLSDCIFVSKSLSVTFPVGPPDIHKYRHV